MSSRSVDSQPPEGAWSEVERELLGAARDERMPAELEARLRDALAFPLGAAEAPRSSAADAALHTSFNDSARARQLFASKLPLWGALGVVALGALSFYALTRGALQPTAAATRPLVTASAAHEAAPLAASASATRAPARSSAIAQHEATTQDGVVSAAPASAQRGGVGLASASAGGNARRDAASAPRDGVGLASASAQAGARRDAADEREASAQRARAGRELAHARGAKRAEPSSVQPRALTSSEPQLAPPMGAANEPNVVSAHAAQSGKVATPDQLRLEAQLLESARSALGQGALPEARQWLARYQAQFARGALQPESQVLGIELAVRTGARTTAKAQAEHFLAQHPHHPLRDRVQLLTREVR